MRRFIYILLFLLSLPFREGAGSVYASYFEVQVPMTEQQPVQVIGHHTMTTGRFATTVNPINANGIAYAPGQTPGTSLSSGPRRGKKMEEDDYEDDPFMGNVVPIGDAPFALFALLLLVYASRKVLRKRKKASL